MDEKLHQIKLLLNSLKREENLSLGAQKALWDIEKYCEKYSETVYNLNNDYERTKSVIGLRDGEMTPDEKVESYKKELIRAFETNAQLIEENERLRGAIKELKGKT